MSGAFAMVLAITGGLACGDNSKVWRFVGPFLIFAAGVLTGHATWSSP